MAAQIGKTTSFDEKLEEWTQYVERLEHFFTANGHTDDDKKKAILLSSIGPTAYKLLRNLVSPQKPGDKTYRELVDIMKKHHNPTPSETVERHKFNSRCHKSGESVAQYFAALRSLAEFCNFEDSLSKMLRDRLVIGVQDSHIQRRLLAEKALSFDKAFELAQSLEQASESAIVIQNGRGATAQDEVVHKIKGTQVTARRPSYKPENRDPVPPCYRCGKSNHLRGSLA